MHLWGGGIFSPPKKKNSGGILLVEPPLKATMKATTVAFRCVS